MEHLAIDLGGRESQICIRSATGEVVGERRVATSSLPKFLARHPASRVIVETCAEAFAIADAAIAAGHEVRVVPSILVRALGVGSHGVKTDQRDAQNLSAASVRMDLPSVHIPSEVSRERKSICGMRDVLVSSRTQLINSVRGWMRRQSVRPRTGSAETFTFRARERLGKSIPSYGIRCTKSVSPSFADGRMIAA
jgi:transposase